MWRNIFPYRDGILSKTWLDTQTQKESVSRPVVRPTYQGSCIAKSSWTDNVRAHADMKIASVKRPIQHITLHPKGHNLCLQGLHGIDIITPGTSTVATFKTGFWICKIRYVLNTASSKRLQYVRTIVPPKPASHRYVFRFYHAPHGVSCLIISSSGTRLGLIFCWDMIVRVQILSLIHISEPTRPY